MDENLLHDVVAAALKAGADGAEAVGAERASLSISVRLGALEEVEREEARDLGLRVFVGKKQATVSGSNLSVEARQRLVERAVAMAKLAPDEPYAGLAPEEHLARGPLPQLELFDPTEPTATEMEDQALATETVMRAVPGVTNSDGASASWSASRWKLVTSTGFAGMAEATGFSLSAAAIAGEGSNMEVGGEGRSMRWRDALPTPEAIGAEAGRRAVSRLGARKLNSMTAPVIFENRLATSLIGPLIGAIAGPAIARGASFLKDKLGQPVFSDSFELIEDPHLPRRLGSAPFDDEGVTNQRRALIDKGVLTTWLLNSASARQLGLETTGHASRGLAGPPGVSTTNLTVKPGTRTQAELMADAKAGVLVTSMFGPSLNGNTGDWSVGVSGFWFENGEIAYPINEITVAGNLIDIWLRVVVGSDLEIRGSANSPSLLIDALAIAGK